jgi:ABC-type transport system involved in multi-copper enzyme maturation permease subunit
VGITDFFTELSLNPARVRPVGIILLVLTAVITVWGTGMLIRTLRAQGNLTTVWMSLRMIWVWSIPLALVWMLIGLALVSAKNPRDLISGLSVESALTLTIPLAAGLHAALALSIPEEPLLELHLTFHRPFVWLAAERFLTILAIHCGIGLLGTVIGIVRYEALQLWRTRVWLVCGLIIMALMILLINGVHESETWRGNLAAIANASPDIRPALIEAASNDSVTGLVSVGLLLLFVSLVLFPLLFADVIARDRQYGVRELWRSLPLGEGNYLVGKISAAMLSILALFVGCSVLIWWQWTVWVFPMPIPTFIVGLALPILPAILANTSLSILLSGGQPTRRCAVLIGFLFVIASLILMGMGARFKVNVWDYFNLGRPLAMRFYYTNFYDLSLLAIQNPNSETALAVFDPISPLQMAVAGVIAFAEVGVVWWLVRYFRLRQEG